MDVLIYENCQYNSIKYDFALDIWNMMCVFCKVAQIYEQYDLLCG